MAGWSASMPETDRSWRHDSNVCACGCLCHVSHRRAAAGARSETLREASGPAGAENNRRHSNAACRSSVFSPSPPPPAHATSPPQKGCHALACAPAHTQQLLSAASTTPVCWVGCQLAFTVLCCPHKVFSFVCMATSGSGGSSCAGRHQLYNCCLFLCRCTFCGVAGLCCLFVSTYKPLPASYCQAGARGNSSPCAVTLLAVAEVAVVQ